jgi:hypothetical protein
MNVRALPPDVIVSVVSPGLTVPGQIDPASPPPLPPELLLPELLLPEPLLPEPLLPELLLPELVEPDELPPELLPLALVEPDEPPPELDERPSAPESVPPVLPASLSVLLVAGVPHAANQSGTTPRTTHRPTEVRGLLTLMARTLRTGRTLRVIRSAGRRLPIRRLQERSSSERTSSAA